MTVLEHFVVYHDPLDHPGAYVVRRWLIERGAGARPEAIIAVATTLEEARAAIPEGCVLIARSPDDDPVIIESWI